MNPIELLKLELKGYKKALTKSIESYSRGVICLDVHNTHKTNLTKVITEYEEAIEKLEL